MRVLLTSFGSTGDVYPLIRLGVALQEAGHEARFATAPLYRQEIEEAGLLYVHTPPDWEHAVFAEFMRKLARIPFPLLQLKEIYKGALPFIHELVDTVAEQCQQVDLLVTSYMFSHFKVIAEEAGIPCAEYAFCQTFVPTPLYPPDPLPRLRGWPPPLHRGWNLFWWRTANRLVDWTLNSVLRKPLGERGYPPVKNFLLEPADLSLVAVSPGLMAGRGWIDPDRFRFVGYLRWQPPHNPALEEELEAFCEGEEVPVLTFGSVSFDDVSSVMSRFLHRWPPGQKIIIQSGWAGLSVELGRPEIKIVGKVSHDQLFAHALCVIHHGGAGTTATVLHAGKPHIVIPHIADQHFFAGEIKRLGVGLALSRKSWPEKLPRAVRILRRRRSYRQEAEKCRRILESENGPKTAVAELEAYVARKQESASPA